MKNPLIALFLMFVCASFAQAQCNPDDTVESWYSWAKEWENYAIDQFPISLSEESYIGDTLHKGMIKENKILNNYSKQANLDGIVKKLSQYVNRKGIKYKIHVIDDSQTMNAFSLAGGHLYITTKMVEWTESEDELAFIVAHEIAHIDNRHAVRKAQKMVIGKSVFEPYGYGDMAASLSLLLSAPFGQIDEYDADRGGATLVSKAGYNPRKGMRFFMKMGEEENYDVWEKIVRTHPYSHERMNCLEAFIQHDLGK